MQLAESIGILLKFNELHTLIIENRALLKPVYSKCENALRFRIAATTERPASPMRAFPVPKLIAQTSSTNPAKAS